MLNVSRTPVHEAVGLLTKDGLVVQVANRRPTITTFSSEEIFDIYEMRRILETEAAYKAATRMDRQTMTHLRERAELFRNAQNAPDVMARWLEFDDIFHAAVAEACGSRRLELDILRYRRLHRVFNRVHVDPSVLVYGLKEHLEILDAIERRDADAARKAMYDHLVEWQRFFVRILGTST
jgi:DNA-binding GntR family transcriptional regulator